MSGGAKATAIIALAVIAMLALNIGLWNRMRRAAAIRAASPVDLDQPPR